MTNKTSMYAQTPEDINTIIDEDAVIAAEGAYTEAPLQALKRLVKESEDLRTHGVNEELAIDGIF